MKIIIEIDVDNDAFGGWDDKEAQRILTNLGKRIDNHGYFTPNKNLRDINGNTVGFFKLVDDEGRVLA